jgi:hypothetical protein
LVNVTVDQFGLASILSNALHKNLFSRFCQLAADDEFNLEIGPGQSVYCTTMTRVQAEGTTLRLRLYAKNARKPGPRPRPRPRPESDQRHYSNTFLQPDRYQPRPRAEPTIRVFDAHADTLIREQCEDNKVGLVENQKTTCPNSPEQHSLTRL